MNSPATIYRKDYRAPDYQVRSLELYFLLDPQATEVTAKAHYQRSSSFEADLRLDGELLELLSIQIDGEPVAENHYRLDHKSLTLLNPPADFVLEIKTRISPATNTALSGLYLSNGVFCTQCEAEGFRRITYFQDRPDVMTVYTVHIKAPTELNLPVLLSNGNPVEAANYDGGHFAVWHDPFPKPSYLFALVAGNLGHVEDHFTTASGRKVKLQIYTEHAMVDQCDHAMESLQRAMRWDETRYGLEYDLDCFNIVAVSDFNMGAMENKGLNVFNTKYVLASPATATDQEFDGVESVIAHEYFHNWTGDRITCRDWFQLSLKEGLTVFRDQEFSADQGSAGLCRIKDVRLLRNAQFAQDAGPMAHSVRPDSYIEINNFYTVTIYEKGAEVVRMYQTLFGREGFRKGMDLYVQRHDGQAVTCDDFRAAMADANHADLEQFALWYSQAGTPEVWLTTHFDPAKQQYILTFRQSCPPTPDQPEKQAMHIPIKVALLQANGRLIAGTERVLELKQAEQAFVFDQITEEPIPSILREFSAPIQLHWDCDDAMLAFLVQHDDDPFNRWESLQKLAQRVLLAQIAGKTVGTDLLLASLKQVLLEREDPAFCAELLTLPTESALADACAVVDPEAIHAAREDLLRTFAEQNQALLATVCVELNERLANAADGAAAGLRALRNYSLTLLARVGQGDLARAQWLQEQNMTDSFAALTALVHFADASAELEAFYQRWQDDPLVLDKWFSVQASRAGQAGLDAVKSLLTHPDFSLTNPNRVRSLLGVLGANPTAFHVESGAGYALLADQIIVLDALNPQIAARLCGPFIRWQRFDERRQQLMKQQIQRILQQDPLSPDVYEILSKSLGN